MTSKFVATYTDCVQIGEFSFQDYTISKVFDYSQSLQDVMFWLEHTVKVENPTLNNVKLSHLYEGE